MDRSRTLVAASLGLCLLNRVEYDSAFVPTGSQRAPAVPRGHATGESARQSQGATTSFGAAAAAAALGVAGLAASARRARARVQVRANDMGIEKRGPIMAYVRALMDGAEKAEESVAVTKDVMKIRDKMLDEEFCVELKLVVNEPLQNELETAKRMVKLLQPLESTVVEKFMVFLAKKKRLMSLMPICKEFTTSMYETQSIEPVMVRSPAKLTDEQLATIKAKMKKMTGASDIKLVNQLDGGLMAGFVVEWGFPDPTKMESPTSGIDLSLKTQLEAAAVDKGVPMEL
mmetsp:Transcript_14826/g.31057  ORF Transcript_14826/g.31057 Transcript_14826/m.31057 type:complete len:287 (-) Transcript_14826:283-1143(-)